MAVLEKWPYVTGIMYVFNTAQNILYNVFRPVTNIFSELFISHLARSDYIKMYIKAVAYQSEKTNQSFESIYQPCCLSAASWKHLMFIWLSIRIISVTNGTYRGAMTAGLSLHRTTKTSQRLRKKRMDFWFHAIFIKLNLYALNQFRWWRINDLLLVTDL